MKRYLFKRIFLVVLLFTLCIVSSSAKIILPSVFSDNSAGGPYNIQIIGEGRLELKNVMLGEVWICSGQSNMEWNLGWNIFNGEEEAAKANHPNIRIFNIPKISAEYPQQDCRATWTVCSPEIIRATSAVGYFFAQQLQEKLNVPVGIIVTCWGGTPAEVWVEKSRIENNLRIMNHKERFYATIHHQPVDRAACWLGLPVPPAELALLNYFGVHSIDQLREVIDDDIYPIEVPYNYPPSNHIACAFNFAKVSHLDTPDEGNAKMIISTSGCFVINQIWFVVAGLRKGTLKEFLPRNGMTGMMISRNWLWSALAGTLWAGQFFFYGLGHVKMGNFQFASWVLHMPMLIFFSYIVGVVVKEWKSVRPRTYFLLIIGLLILISSFCITSCPVNYSG